jgi:hypothetical protein
MAWWLAALLLLVIPLAVLAKNRRPRGTLTTESSSGQRPREQRHTPLMHAESPAIEPEPAPVKNCPVCLSEYPTRNRFCVRDGVELMEGHAPGPFAQGMICPTCRRGYPFDAGFCPEDADELVPYGLYGAASATRPPLRLDANKICPECGIRHAAAHLFCGHDGTQLVVVN